MGKHVVYISPPFTGVKPVFYEGKQEVMGMPAFFEVMTRVLKHPEVSEVTFFLLTSEDKPLNIHPEYAQRMNIIPIVYKSSIGQVKAILKCIRLFFAMGLKRKADVLYGHGSLGGGTATLLRKLSGVPSVTRVYGTFLINSLHVPNWKLFKSHPLEFLAFSKRSKAVVITNDGTHGDQVYQKINRTNKGVHFFLNGIDKQSLVEDATEVSIPLPPKYISYVARIDNWKRQHLLVDALAKIKAEQGLDIPAVIVGPVMAKDYHQQLLDTIAEHNLSVTIVPGLPKKEVLQVIRKSWFTCSLYHTSNLGNVFLEGLTMGKAILAINYNHSLDVIDAEAYCGVTDDNVHEGVLALWEDPELIKSLEKKAELFADQTLGSWDTRAEKEIQLLVAD